MPPTRPTPPGGQPESPQLAPMVLVSMGNSRTRVTVAESGQLRPSVIHPTDDQPGLASAIAELAREQGDPPRPVVLASVNASAAEDLEMRLSGQGLDVQRFGRDLPIPIALDMDDPTTVGQDRLLDALGAFHRSQQACIVIDAGTAITVDFVDGEGTFHGGAIGPGLGMMLRALHEQTAALPKVTLDPALAPPPQFDPEDPNPMARTPFGKSTPHAMTVGVVSAARGMVHLLIDRYADFYNGYPRVVATGGDAGLLFEHDALVEHVVPDLTLLGMLAALERLAKLDEEHGDDLEAGEGSA